MRLWTFQHKSALSVLDDGFWYSNLNRSRRIKLVDEQYVQEDFKLPNGKIMDVAPIYCFASLNGEYFPALSLRSFYSNYSHLVGYMNFDLTEMIMLELEVSEDQILQAKKNNNWYVKYDDDMPRGLRDWERGKYAHIVDEDTICHNDYLTYVRTNRCNGDIECLLPCINLYNVAAIRTFSKKGFSGGKYGTAKVETIYSNPMLSPLFTETIYVNGDGYPRMIVDGKLTTISLDATYDLLDKYGLDGVFSYQTIEEVLETCNKATVDKLRQALSEKGLDIKTVLNEKIESLFPNGLFL